MIQVLDQGYVQKIEHWGSDQGIIEAARMSTDKGFLGWEPEYRMKCHSCGATYQPGDWDSETCAHCERGRAQKEIMHPGDAKLLKYLWEHKHMTPFEMAGLTIEVKLPIFVVREWHRHRTQSYSEMSARYVPLPDENYMPTAERIMEGAKTAAGNRQAQGAKPLANEEEIWAWMAMLANAYDYSERTYQKGIELGVPKEVARLIVPVGRYTRMRATANLRNWLGFLQLRDTAHAPGAQWEIRQYADAVGQLIQEAFPRTHALFNGE